MRPRATDRITGGPIVLAVFSFRYDAHLVPALLSNIEPLVDGWISYDDRASTTLFSDEPARRHALLAAARDAGADWVLAVDPDERFEAALASEINKLTAVEGVLAYSFAVREMYGSDYYRIDGVWGQKRQSLLLRLTENFATSPSPLHSPWHMLIPGARVHDTGFNVYHLKMITAARRQARADLYNHLDPEKRIQPIGYDYLANESGAEFERIPQGREYMPVHIEDGGLWMPVPTSLRSSV